MERIADISCFFLDMDGTIYLSDVLIDGATAFLQAVEAAGKSFLFPDQQLVAQCRVLPAEAHVWASRGAAGQDPH